jgi:DNA-binding Lrp family transcriptional regulator
VTTTIDSPDAQSHAFQADVARLLHLMVHSIYSDRDIFLRELISNGADACEKLRYEALARPELLGEETPFAIELTIDKEAGLLTISDNGLGMSRTDLVDALGTIAAFIATHKIGPSLSEVAGRLNIHKTAAQRSVARLIDQGFLMRTTVCTRGVRASTLALSPRAVTNSSVRRLRNRPRTTRASCAQPVSDRITVIIM